MLKSITPTKKRIIRSGKPWTPHAYQKRGVKFLVEHQAAALLEDPGLGKTSQVYAAFSFLNKRKLAHRMLVVAPLRPCYLVWPAEAKEWQDFQHLKIVVLHGRDKEAMLEHALESDAEVLVINPEGLEWLFGAKNGKVDMRRFKRLGIDTLVLDELTKWKHSKGRRFKMLKQVLGTFQRRWGLTGTPNPNGLLDLFGQMYVLDQGRSLGQFITHYRINYFVNPDGKGWKWVPQDGAEERIYERIRPLALRMEAKDYLELPERVDIRIDIDLPPKVIEMYDRLEDDLITKLDKQLIVASNAAAASTKLRQICNGAVYVDDDLSTKVFKGGKRSVQLVHDLKLDAVEELVEELNGQPLLLAYEFNHDLDRLLGRFGKETPYIGSGVSPARSRDIESAWNSGYIPLLLGHPASMGHGLNFQKGNAAHVGWFGMFWDLELYLQFIMRILRQGNKARRVFNYHFIARRDNALTVDQLIYIAQRRKERGQQALSDALKDLRAAAKGRK